MKRIWRQTTTMALAIAAALALTPGQADAQISRLRRVESRNAIGFNLGYFALRGEDTRVGDDVLLADLQDLAFEIKDFNSASFGGEWLFGLGEYLEGGLGAGFYQRTVPSVYRAFTFDDNSEITQDLKLRVVPMTATVRFLPIGRGSVQPYVGVGIGLFNWRYSEVGDFLDASDGTIFHHRYTASGNATGPVILGGIRGPFADVWLVGAEVRYQRAEGDTKSATSGLIADKIDLGGWTANFTVHLRF